MLYNQSFGIYFTVIYLFSLLIFMNIFQKIKSLTITDDRGGDWKVESQ